MSVYSIYWQWPRMEASMLARRTQGIALAIYCLFQTSAQSQSQLLPKIEINITETIREIAGWVSAYIARTDRLNTEENKLNRPKLIKQLTDLASLKRHAADELESFALQIFDQSSQLYEIHNVLRRINFSMKELSKTIENMDPEWVSKNRDTYSKATFLKYDKTSIIIDNIALFNEDSQSNEIALRIAASFRQEADKLDALARKLEE